MRFALCDYDKPHRCPGWSGAGWRYNKQDWCDGADLPEGVRRWAWRGEEGGYGPGWFLRIRKTNCCGTYVLPHFLIWFDLGTWKSPHVVRSMLFRLLPTRVKAWWWRR